MQKLTHYKRLLERAQSANAAQLHALQAELRLLRGQQIIVQDTPRPALTLDTHWRAADEGAYQDVDLAAALRGDGRGVFNEAEVRKAVRSLKQPDRMRLLTIILDCASLRRSASHPDSAQHCSRATSRSRSCCCRNTRVRRSTCSRLCPSRSRCACSRCSPHSSSSPDRGARARFATCRG